MKTNRKHSQGSTIPKPLAGKTFYLDIAGHRNAGQLERDMVRLGATIEKCFSKEVVYLITNNNTKNAAGNSSKSPANPSPFSASYSADSPQADSPSAVKKSLPLTRGMAIARKAKHTKNYGSTNIIECAKQWKIKIVSIEDTEKWVSKELLKLPSEDKSKQTSKSKSKKLKVQKLQCDYVKIEDCSAQYRPIYTELKSFPTINTDTLIGTSPFEGCFKKKAQEEPALNAECDVAEDIDMKSPGASTGPATKAPKTVPATASKSKQKSKGLSHVENKHFTPRVEQKKGYCELCNLKYDNIDVHIKMESHKKFVRNKQNFISLDLLIERGPNMDQFLNDVVKYHKEHVQEGLSLYKDEEIFPKSSNVQVSLKDCKGDLEIMKGKCIGPGGDADSVRQYQLQSTEVSQKHSTPSQRNCRRASARSMKGSTPKKAQGFTSEVKETTNTIGSIQIIQTEINDEVKAQASEPTTREHLEMTHISPIKGDCKLDNVITSESEIIPVIVPNKCVLNSSMMSSPHVKKIKLDESFKVLSERSMRKMLTSDKDDPDFHGFCKEDKADIPTDVSYVDISEVDMIENVQITKEVDVEDDRKECPVEKPVIKTYSKLDRGLLSSPAKLKTSDQVKIIKSPHITSPQHLEVNSSKKDSQYVNTVEDNHTVQCNTTLEKSVENDIHCDKPKIKTYSKLDRNVASSPVKNDSTSGTPKCLKIGEKMQWSVLSDRSLKRILNSEGEQKEFDGFNDTQRNLASDLSYVDLSSDKSDNGDHIKNTKPKSPLKRKLHDDSEIKPSVHHTLSENKKQSWEEAKGASNVLNTFFSQMIPTYDEAEKLWNSSPMKDKDLHSYESNNIDVSQKPKSSKCIKSKLTDSKSDKLLTNEKSAQKFDGSFSNISHGLSVTIPPNVSQCITQTPKTSPVTPDINYNLGPLHSTPLVRPMVKRMKKAFVQLSRLNDHEDPLRRSPRKKLGLAAGSNDKELGAQSIEKAPDPNLSSSLLKGADMSSLSDENSSFNKPKENMFFKTKSEQQKATFPVKTTLSLSNTTKKLSFHKVDQSVHSKSSTDGLNSSPSSVATSKLKHLDNPNKVLGSPNASDFSGNVRISLLMMKNTLKRQCLCNEHTETSICPFANTVKKSIDASEKKSEAEVGHKISAAKHDTPSVSNNSKTNVESPARTFQSKSAKKVFSSDKRRKNIKQNQKQSNPRKRLKTDSKRNSEKGVYDFSSGLD